MASTTTGAAGADPATARAATTSATAPSTATATTSGAGGRTSAAKPAKASAVKASAAKASAAKASAASGAGGTGRRTQGRPSARERLLGAANELFYSEGVHSVGIDRIIEHAGVAKASLYNTFGNKEGLVGAYLESRHERLSARITRVMSHYDTPRDRLLSVFDAQAESFADPEFNGCAFVAAASEAPHRATVERASDGSRAWLRGLFADLAAQAGAADPEALGCQLFLLYDGAHVAVRMDRDRTAAATARAAAAALLDASLAAAPAARA